MPTPVKNAPDALPTMREIEGTLAEASTALIATTLERLAACGIAAGQLVLHEAATYRLTKIEVSVNIHARAPHLTVWCYGNKLRRDGTYGTHHHALARPHDLTPLKS